MGWWHPSGESVGFRPESEIVWKIGKLGLKCENGSVKPATIDLMTVEGSEYLTQCPDVEPAHA